jgi:translation elongation factor EF-Ts
MCPQSCQSAPAEYVVALHPAVPDSVRAAEGVMLQSQAAQSGKPANVLEKMVVGRLNK